MAEQKRTIVFSVGGRSYRVVTSAGEDEIRRLAAVVDERMSAIAGGRQPGMEALVLTAISLAHDAEAHKARADEIAQGARNVMGRMLKRIDTALEQTPPEQNPADEGKG
jgi:cell division protein ZapA (FtsZ GTPase activity inhibitor)